MGLCALWGRGQIEILNCHCIHERAENTSECVIITNTTSDEEVFDYSFSFYLSGPTHTQCTNAHRHTGAFIPSVLIWKAGQELRARM